MTKLAHLISNVIHPIVLPIVAFWTIMRFGFEKPVENMHLYLLVVILTCSAAPALIVIALKKMGKVSDYDISRRESRALPFLLGVASYVAGALALRLLNAPPLIVGFMMCYAINTIFIFLITLVWKISVHVTSLGGPIAAMTYVFGAQSLWLLLLMPPLAWARVHLRAHTPMQTIAGGALGFSATLLELWWWFGRGNF
ncbi:MAG: hypothetical protein NZM06_06210 [Chloroherpetonaceae bacterium]|nr:hypothetical protein [Chloroherpetonaceae bacterium]MDW8437495.1 hypothetical protein [Chloroherpetonaceae bacterium]